MRIELSVGWWFVDSDNEVESIDKVILMIDFIYYDVNISGVMSEIY